MLLRQARLNQWRKPVHFGVEEVVKCDIKAVLRRGRWYKNLHYLLLEAVRLAIKD